MTFKGTADSDFLKLVKVEDFDKQNLINFGASDFLTIRDSLIEYIKAVYPLDYNYFSESDFGMMMIELVAYLGHIMSYKADFLANENFISTARSRKSVKNLLELIGIRMKGPVAAAANAMVTFDSDPGWTASSFVVIPPENRVVTVKSVEDSNPITFTLYKVAANGDIDATNPSGNIIIYNSEKSSTTALYNLTLLEGSLVVQQGNFSDTEALKSVTLERSPVIEGSVQAFISGAAATSGQYRQVENLFYASGANDKVFQLLTDEQYNGVVVFGDNNLGRVPSIGDSYTIIYRFGGGSRGNIPNSLINAESVAQFYANSTASGTETSITVANISKGTGGADAETLDHAKKYGPLRFRSQDRLVTLLDYKSFVNSFITSYGSIGKATAATRRAYSSANIIDVFVLEKSNDIQLRKATPEYKRQIAQAISDKKMMTDEVIIVDGLIRTLDLIITLRVDKRFRVLENTIKLKAGQKISEYFNVDNNDFGKEFNPQELLYKIFEIDEIRFATVDNVANAIQLAFNEIAQLNNYTLNVEYV